MEIQIKNVPEDGQGKYPVYFASREAVRAGDCLLYGGQLRMEKSFEKRGAALRIREQEVEWKDITGIYVMLDEQRQIGGYWKEDRPEPMSVQELRCAQEEKKETRELEREINATNVRRRPESTESGSVEVGTGDKWEQLLHMYPQVHPFGDERVFLSIEPKDFVVLQAPYQKLVNNSFLLHGFYNYRHMILGEDVQIGGSEERCFYLGVPGTYFEREKKVAVMFGFEGFESNGPIEIGKFGYYLRRVAI